MKAGTIIDKLVLSIDLAPTLLEVAGKSTNDKMHGRSLVPLLKGRTKNWRTSFLIEYYSDVVFPRMLTMGYHAVRTERFKYIKYKGLRGMDELYDLQSDPYEMKNLVDDSLSRPILLSMKTELAKLLKESP